MNTIFMPNGAVKNFAALARLHAPNEICGLITGKNINNVAKADTIHHILNIFKETPRWGYNMEPNEMFKVLKTTTMFDLNNTTDLCGIIHSHPLTSAVPSLTDILYAKKSGYKTFYLIFSVIDDNFNSYFWNGNNFNLTLLNLYEKI
jgi:proteasome lid subunit RPN8/RPN11